MRKLRRSQAEKLMLVLLASAPGADHREICRQQRVVPRQLRHWLAAWLQPNQPWPSGLSAIHSASREASAIGIIGGVDGPTALYLASRLTAESSQQPRLQVWSEGDRRLLRIKHAGQTTCLQLPPEPLAAGQAIQDPPRPCDGRSYAEWGGCRDLEHLLALGFDLERGMGLRFDTRPRSSRYEATPPIGVVVAETGSDGMHLCLVPRHGATSLDDAEVWPISPMDFDQPHSVLPRPFPFREFLRVFITLPNGLWLFELRPHYSRERFAERVRHFTDMLESDPERDRLVQAIAREFALAPIPDLYRHLYPSAE